ncbi:MAG: Xaa-Pro peptidase family protein [Firmicutes bacterium]|nr:Xaa-Pro peptidase family protein [Bacillota bacterium]
MRALYRQRLQALRELLARQRVEALLVTHLPNIFYLCGFTGSSGALLVEPDRATLITDPRYSTQACDEVHVARVRVAAQGLLTAVAGLLAGRRRRLKLAFEAAHVPVSQRDELVRRLGRQVHLRGVAGWVEALRARKDAEELERMRASAALACQVWTEVLPLVRPGVRELELAAEIEYRMRRAGASGPAFDTIVASGARAALPHGRATAKQLQKNELVVFDWGAILRGYCSDLTRTVFLGRAPARIRKWYDVVRAAQQAAWAMLRPGVAAEAVDAAARSVLQRHGLARYFTHSTGHGLGIEVHEEPRLARRQKTRLEAGHVVTIEPGIYLPGMGGIRIEDDLAVTPVGATPLTHVPRELLEL